CIRATERFGALEVHFERLLGLWICIARTDHNDAVTDDELGVLDSSFVALDLDAYLEAEGAAQPVDRAGGIVVNDRRADSWPSFGGVLHGVFAPMRLLRSNCCLRR